jgi:geranylgeranyl diphosphate synthase type I
MQELKQKKQLIDQFLIQYLDRSTSRFQSQSLSQVALSHLSAFSISGKSVRGGLFLLAAEALDSDNYQKHQADLLKVAAALELIQSGLLIHDDIIDRDAMRRDNKSTWATYTAQTPNSTLSPEEKKHFGYSMAICVGTIAQYLAFDLLEQLESLPEQTRSLLRQHISREISRTYFAEMLDEQITVQEKQPSKEEVLEMYLYKTARYTMVLPLALAAIAGQSSPETSQQLEKIGEKLGLIFQIKDDEISLFATQAHSGKSFASDLKNGKRTIFYLTVLENLSKTSPDQQTFSQLFGKTDLSDEEVSSLQKIFTKYAQPSIQKHLGELEQASLQLIDQLNATKETKKLLQEILFFSLKRDR